MKLAEALLLRSDMMKKLGSLKNRIEQNAMMQEGDDATENPERLIEESFSVLSEMESLMCRINQANMRGAVSDGMNLMEALARRDRLLAERNVLQGAIENTHREHRYSHDEIRWVRTLDVVALQKKADEVEEKIRNLNIALQEANWKTEME